MLININDTARLTLEATIKKIDGAYAPATIRAYKSNFENFIKFCDENNTSALPTSSEIVASYIKKLSTHLKSSSIKIAVASIAALHNLNSLNDPTQHPDVKIEMRRMYKTLGRYAKQAYGINKDLLDKMVAATDNSLRGVRDKAILLVAYDSLCRRSELVSLEFEDLMIDIISTMPAGYTVGDVSSPAPLEVGAGKFLTSDLQVSTYYTD
jgi:site-specific recombinase XerD